MVEILSLFALGSLIWGAITLRLLLEEFKRFRADFRRAHRIELD